MHTAHRVWWMAVLARAQTDPQADQVRVPNSCVSGKYLHIGDWTKKLKRIIKRESGVIGTENRDEIYCFLTDVLDNQGKSRHHFC
jgi:hypothetical protein